VLDYAAEKSNIHEVYLHVWVKNEDALNWYLKQGFKNAETIQNYYKNIEEPHCHLLVKSVEHAAVAPSAAAGKTKN
jgi:N-alpha-acetyltransferase 50